MRILPGLALLTTLLTGCNAATSDACPVEVQYSAAFMTLLAMELKALPKGAALGTAMADYGRLRDQTRACRGAAR